VFYLFVAATSTLFAYLASKLEYEEDISKLLPSTDNTKAEGLAFSELKVKDRIYLLLTSKSDVCDADMLLEAADMFVDTLQQATEAEIFYQIDDAMRQQALAFLLNNISTLIDLEVDSVRLAHLLRRDAVFAKMAENRALLSTPESSALYRIMRYDPLGMREAFMGSDNVGIEQLLGGNYALYGNHLFTRDTTAAVVLISPRFVSFDSGVGTHLIGKIESARSKIQTLYPGIEILFHGPPVQSVFNSRQIKKDLKMTTGVSLLLACLLIALFFKSWHALPQLVFPVIYGALFAMACMYLIQGRMSLMALGVGAIALGVALSYCLHVITHSQYVSDPVQLLREQVKPVILGALTTIGAFMGMMFTQSSLLRDFGLFASLAMTGTTLASLCFLPQWTVRSRRSMDTSHSLLSRINAYPFEQHGWLFIAISIVFAVSIYKSADVQFDSNLRNIGYNEPEVMRSAAMYAQKTVGGLSTSYYAAVCGDLDSAKYINVALSRVCDSLQKAGAIESYTHSASLLLPDAARESRKAAWKSFWNEARITALRSDISEAAKANGFKSEMFEPFFQIITDSATLNDSEQSAGMLQNMMEKQGSNYLIYTAVNMQKEKTGAVNDCIASLQGVIVADPFYYTANMVETIHRDFNTVLWVSSLFVLLTLLVAFRNIVVALIAFLPMSISWYMTLGLMALMGLQFNLINIVISAFIFGIGVDYSIFVMEGLLDSSSHRFTGSSNNLLTEHKTAIMLSAIILIISISSLIFATHPALSSIGLASLTGMSVTILLTYTVEPLLFILYTNKSRAQI